MVRTIPTRRWLQIAALAALFSAILPRAAHAQGFISPSYGYNFGGDAGCRTATDCRNKNWNWGASIGALGSIVGFEAEWTHEGEFTGDTSTRTSVTTLMGNFLVCPRITIVQPYGLVGLGLIRTKVDNVPAAVSDSKDQLGWTIGGGVIVFVQKHIGLKGDVRYYHSVQPLGLLGFDLGDENKIDFGRAGLGVVFRF